MIRPKMASDLVFLTFCQALDFLSPMRLKINPGSASGIVANRPVSGDKIQEVVSTKAKTKPATAKPLPSPSFRFSAIRTMRLAHFRLARYWTKPVFSKDNFSTASVGAVVGGACATSAHAVQGHANIAMSISMFFINAVIGYNEWYWLLDVSAILSLMCADTCYRAVRPPSIISSLPVIYDASSEARKRAP